MLTKALSTAVITLATLGGAPVAAQGFDDPVTYARAAQFIEDNRRMESRLTRNNLDYTAWQAPMQARDLIDSEAFDTPRLADLNSIQTIDVQPARLIRRTQAQVARASSVPEGLTPAEYAQLLEANGL
ncbi:hypothetical protein [Pontivivens ytuae]|uniref:Uncharacterized protein n=1 Tax=Pontivivens ytuae TaxID=2789856 RepID=A0A7S9LUB0_9RHOB|nr:hypothetical protein [Pontivivens ytuae]QPH55303.1 hypothetical protein I0K15_06070 [Pontivivens ytuae]